MRSVRAEDYQDLPRAVSVMVKAFPSGSATDWHAHPRAQVLYASEGLMFTQTAVGRWAVPSEHALLIPAGLAHRVAMHGPVCMQTAYIAPAAATAFDRASCRVVRVSALLAACLAALAEEPPLYDRQGRGAHLSALVLDELARAEDAPLALPLPQHPRLKALCQALIDRPEQAPGLDAIAEEVGMSRRTLTRRFRAETGLSILAWRNRARLLRSMILQAGGLSESRAAQRVGFRKVQSLREAAATNGGRVGLDPG